MAANVDLAAVGRLLAAPARAAMLDALFDGQPWSGRELAAVARISPSTASEHLQLLRRGGLVVASRDGRYRRYRLASAEVADALEWLGTLAPPLRARRLSDSSRNEALHLARTCYDHLAGRLGVAITDSLAERIDTEALRRSRRPLSRACLDWSERKPHLAGALGAALLARLESVHGLERLSPSRAIRVRPPGRTLLEQLDIVIQPEYSR